MTGSYGPYSWENILEFGLREKIVTPHTAYIVLERTEDYIKYNIAPPEELEEECEKLNYVKKDTRLQRENLKKTDEFAILSDVVKQYNNRVRKLDADEKPVVLDQAEYNKEKELAKTETEGAKPISLQNDILTGSAAGLIISNVFSMEEEVVVVGYGTARKSSITGSVAYIRSNELQSGGFMSVEQALQGRVAGLEVINTNVSPGSFAGIRIRGSSSLSGNYEPLYVLDGIPVSGNINNIINVNDIENITVLKDISASSLYGSRAANGAIVITSKKGKAYYRNYNKPYRLRDMDDVDYLLEIKEVPYTEKRSAYQRLKQQHEDEPGFYFDIAQHFFESGLEEEAKDILMNAAEVSNGSYQVLRAMGYVLESWKQFDEAIKLYRQLLDDMPSNIYSHRDLAWAYYQNGNYQEAVNVLYAAIKSNVPDNEWRNVSLKLSCFPK
ncbi:MAG: TonB-dependent receptor plug domain-containing protein [Bacteroidota bacterium]